MIFLQIILDRVNQRAYDAFSGMINGRHNQSSEKQK